jgi:hypothetical protein
MFQQKLQHYLRSNLRAGPWNSRFLTKMPVVRIKNPGTFPKLAMWPSWHGRRRLRPNSDQPAAMGGWARAGDGRGSLRPRLLRLVGAGTPPEGAAGRAGRWPPRALLLRRSCVSGGAIDDLRGWGGGPRWWWCAQVGQWQLDTGSSPWRPPWRPGRLAVARGGLGMREDRLRLLIDGWPLLREVLARQGG